MSTNSKQKRAGAGRVRPMAGEPTAWAPATRPSAAGPTTAGPTRSGRKAVAVLAGIGSAAAIAGMGITALTAMNLAQVSAQPGQGGTQTATLTGFSPPAVPTGAIQLGNNPLGPLFNVPTSFPGSAAVNLGGGTSTGNQDPTGFSAFNGGLTQPTSLFPGLSAPSKNDSGYGLQYTIGGPLDQLSSDPSTLFNNLSSALGLTFAPAPGNNETGGNFFGAVTPTAIANALNGGPVLPDQAQANISSYVNSVGATAGLGSGPFAGLEPVNGLISGIQANNNASLQQSLNGDTAVNNLFGQFVTTTVQQNASSNLAGQQSPTFLSPNEAAFIDPSTQNPVAQAFQSYTLGQVPPGAQELSDSQLLASGQAANGGPQPYFTLGEGLTPITLTQTGASGTDLPAGITNPFGSFTGGSGGSLQDLMTNSGIKNNVDGVADGSIAGLSDPEVQAVVNLINNSNDTSTTKAGAANPDDLSGVGIGDVLNSVNGTAINSTGASSFNDDLKSVGDAVNNALSGTSSGTSDGAGTSGIGTSGGSTGTGTGTSTVASGTGASGGSAGDGTGTGTVAFNGGTPYFQDSGSNFA